MKKKLLIVGFIVVLFLLNFRLEAKTSFPNENDLTFAKQFFNLLYYYDAQAVRYAKESSKIKTQAELAEYFKEQAAFVSKLKGSLSTIVPTENFSKAYIAIFRGFEEQENYLNNMYKEVGTGSSFDEAFAMNNWGFINAQKHIQSGVGEFKVLLNSLSDANQMQILSSTGITEEQLKQDAKESEFIMNVQDSLK